MLFRVHTAKLRGRSKISHKKMTGIHPTDTTPDAISDVYSFRNAYAFTKLVLLSPHCIGKECSNIIKLVYNNILSDNNNNKNINNNNGYFNNSTRRPLMMADRRPQ